MSRAPSDDGLFQCGPPRRLKTWLGLYPNVRRGAVLAALIAWAPLALLAAIQSAFAGSESIVSFASDLAVHTRCLIAVPLLVLAEAIVAPRLETVARHFTDAGLIAAADRPRFDAVLASTRRLKDSLLSDVVVVAFAWGLIPALLLKLPLYELPYWQRSSAEGASMLSPAGWWAVLVTLPLLLFLLLGWLWRLLLWTRFLLRVSRLDLQLVPAHPDRAAGLMFVSHSLRAFSLLGLAVGCIVAGALTKRVVVNGESPLDHRYLIAGVVFFTAVALTLPLLAFTDRLIHERRRGSTQYGGLAVAVGQRFERRWLSRQGQIGDEALEAPDFSAQTDLYSIVRNVYDMRLVPVDARSVLILVWATLLPFVPVLLMAVPLDTILQRAVQLLVS